MGKKPSKVPIPATQPSTSGKAGSQMFSDRRLVVVGAQKEEDSTLPTCWILDEGSDGGWQQLTTLPKGKKWFGYCACETERGFLVVGGEEDGKATNQCYHYDI